MTVMDTIRQGKRGKGGTCLQPEKKNDYCNSILAGVFSTLSTFHRGLGVDVLSHHFCIRTTALAGELHTCGCNVDDNLHSPMLTAVRTPCFLSQLSDVPHPLRLPLYTIGRVNYST